MNSTPKTTDKAPRSRRRALTLGVAVAVCALSLAVGYPYYRHAMTHVSTDDAFVEAHVVPVSPRVSGHVDRVLVTDNEMVRKGQLLAEIDADDFRTALDAARARMQAAQAAVTQAEAVTSAARNALIQKQAALASQTAGLEQVRAEVDEVSAGHARDENDLERIRKIVAAGAVSRQEYDHAKAQEAMARAQLDSATKQMATQNANIRQARAAANAAEDELHQAQAVIEIRRADLSEAEAEVHQAELDLSHTRIIAPCAGHVTKKAVEAGTYVQVGQKLFSVVSPEVWVVANFKETQLAGIHTGQPVDIEVDTYPDVTFHGRVDSIQRGTGARFSLLPPENATGNYIKVVQRVPVKIVLDGEEPLDQFVLAPGMSVVPSVALDDDTKTVHAAVSKPAVQ